jgi:RNA polymerase sigma factor (sigma-70 family)
VEASAIRAGPGLSRPRIALGTPLLRLRSDQQLVALFREGHEEAFRVIHDRYRPRLTAYVRQMLPGRAADVEDALQDVFVRTYAGLRTSNREVALRPWLYRVAHNRCIDELRRPLVVPELLEAHDRISDCDPAAETERRESLRRLVIDIGRLPDQQRSALLMREMSGMAYADVSCALGISVPAVKSLLVRARIGLALALEARDAACGDIRRELAEAHEEGVRPSWMARRHLRDCPGCRACRAEMRAQHRRVAALAPTIGPLAVLAKLFGVGTGTGGGTATAAGAGGATTAGGTVTAASGLATVTVGHVATILAAAAVTAGGAVAVQQTVAAPSAHHAKNGVQAAPAAATDAATEGTLRVPALVRPAPAKTHSPAPPVSHAPPTASPSSTSARLHGIPRLPAATPGDIALTGQATSSDATTCAPPPPPPTACTASGTTTCSTGSDSTTSSGTHTTTTGQTATTGQTSTTPGGTTTTPTGSGTTSTGTNSGSTTSGTSTGTAGTAGTTGTTCSSTTQSTGTQGTEGTGGGTGTGTGSGQTGQTGQTGGTQANRPT